MFCDVTRRGKDGNTSLGRYNWALDIGIDWYWYRYGYWYGYRYRYGEVRPTYTNTTNATATTACVSTYIVHYAQVAAEDKPRGRKSASGKCGKRQVPSTSLVICFCCSQEVVPTWMTATCLLPAHLIGTCSETDLDLAPS